MRADAVAAERTTLIEMGYTILESRPDSYYDKDHTSIRDLVTAEGEPVTVEHLTDVTLKFAHVRLFYTGDVDVAYYVTDPGVAALGRSAPAGTSADP